MDDDANMLHPTVLKSGMDTGHFFGPASNPTHLPLTRDPTRPGSIKMLLYACKNNMKPLKHFIIVQHTTKQKNSH